MNKKSTHYPKPRRSFLKLLGVMSAGIAAGVGKLLVPEAQAGAMGYQPYDTWLEDWYIADLSITERQDMYDAHLADADVALLLNQHAIPLIAGIALPLIGTIKQNADVRIKTLTVPYVPLSDVMREEPEAYICFGTIESLRPGEEGINNVRTIIFSSGTAFAAHQGNFAEIPPSEVLQTYHQLLFGELDTEPCEPMSAMASAKRSAKIGGSGIPCVPRPNLKPPCKKDCGVHCSKECGATAGFLAVCLAASIACLATWWAVVTCVAAGGSCAGALLWGTACLYCQWKCARDNRRCPSGGGET